LRSRDDTAPLWPPSPRPRAVDVLGVGQNALDRIGRVERHPRKGEKQRLLDSHDRPGGQVATAVLRSPLVLSAAAGLTASFVGWPLPGPLATFCDILGAAAAPCALFAIGLFLVGRAPHTGIGEVAWVVAIKLLVQPLVTWWLAYRVLEMEAVWAASSVILAALPTGALVFVLAQQYGIYVQRATAAIMVSTLLSVVTLSLLLVLLGVY